MSSANHVMPRNFTLKIIFAMCFGALVGMLVKISPLPDIMNLVLVDGIFQTGGTMFIDLMKMLVVPVVFVSLVCGSSSFDSASRLGRIGLKTFLLYIFTTVIALILALSVAVLFHIGGDLNLAIFSTAKIMAPPSLRDVLINMVPRNPIQAMATGNMMQLIVFSLLLGFAIMMAGQQGAQIRKLFLSANEIVMKLVYIVMLVAPYGIFFLLAALFARQGADILIELLQYFITVIAVLFIHLFVTYSLMLKLIGHLNPIIFFRKLYSAMLFAFGVSSSNASIPVVLETVEEKLGVNNAVAAFVIPLGATINMDGTAIMQGVATVFIAHAYHIDIGLAGYLTVVLMATLASIGTAGVPSVGLITLTMVLQQVGLPAEGIALIIGVDRILDMLRTTVNISGDAMVSCLVARSEKLLDEKIYAS